MLVIMSNYLKFVNQLAAILIFVLLKWDQNCIFGFLCLVKLQEKGFHL